MKNFLTPTEEVVYSKYRKLFQEELKPHLKAINEILIKINGAVMANSANKSKKDFSEEEIDYICKTAVLQIFQFRRDIAISYYQLNVSVDQKYLPYLDDWFSEGAAKIALLTIKIVFHYDEIR